MTKPQWLAALALACACSLLFLREALLPGRALVPHPPELFDVHMAEAVAAGTFDAVDAFRGNVGMTDKYLQSLCWDRVMQDRLRACELPRWTNDIGSGAAFVPQMAQPYQPINLLLLLLPSVQWYGWWYFVHQVLFGVFAYAFVRRLGCVHGAGLLALVAAELGLWTQCKLHHNVILTAALSLWPMLSAVHALVADGVRGRVRAFAVGWLGLWTGLSWSTGFVPVALQATYLTGLCALVFVITAERGDRWRRLVGVGLGIGLGAWQSAANMIPILFAAADSARPSTLGFDQLRELGIEWEHALTACWPDLLSWASDRFYPPAGYDMLCPFETHMPWTQLLLMEHPRRASDNAALHGYVESAFAIGLVPIAAGLAAFVRRERRLLAIAFAVIALMWFGFATTDEPFFSLARLLPGFAAGDLRRQLFTVAMALVVLSGLGADALLRGGRRWPTFVLLLVAALVSAVALLWLWRHGDDASFTRGCAELYALDTRDPNVIAANGSVDSLVDATNDAAKPGEAAHNHAMLVATAWRALFVALAGLVALRLRVRWWVPVWLAATAAELLHAGLGPVQTVPADRVTRIPAVLQPVAAAALPNGERSRLCRFVGTSALVVDALPGNFPGFFGIEDTSAYNPLPPARFEAFMKAIDDKLPRGGNGVGAVHDAAALQHPLCDLFGFRFVLTRETLPVNERLVDRTPPGTGVFHLYERTTTLAHATFVQQVDVIADAAARLAELGKRNRDVAHRVVLEDASAPAADARKPANATATIIERRDERVVVNVRTEAAGYLRLADPWDDGWRASLDTASTPLYVADHYLRAVFVPAGEHEVVLTYDSARVVWPLRLTLLAYVVVAWLLVRGSRKAP